MIDENELMKHLGYFMDRRQLEKDYLLNLMLKIFSTNRLSSNLVFKGGTAMSYFYGLDRFSEDLDFSYMFGKAERLAAAVGLIDGSIERIRADYNSNYTVRKSKVGVLVRDGTGVTTGMRNEFFIEGPLFRKTGASHKIKFEVSMRNDLILVPQTAERFVSKYADVGSMLVYLMAKEEILSEKACAVLERNNARDLYDMYFLMRYKGAEFDSGLFAKKAGARGEAFTLREVRRRIKSFSVTLWKEELSHLIKQPPNLGDVKKFLLTGL